MAVAADLVDLRDARVTSLALVCGVRDRPRDGVVPVAAQHEKRPALRALRVDARLRPRIEIRRCSLEERTPRSCNVVLVIQALRLLRGHSVREGVAELREGQRDCTLPIR